jgi:hypothetical protein
MPESLKHQMRFLNEAGNAGIERTGEISTYQYGKDFAA